MSTAEALGTLPTVAPPRRSRTRSALIARYAPAFFTAVGALGLIVTLVVTIYFTLLDLQWIAFLLGVLFAAVLALVSQTLRAQWRVARKAAQLKRARELLAEETHSKERAIEAAKAAECRQRKLLDELPVMLFLVDRQGRLRQANRAFCTWSGRDAAALDGILVGDLLGGSANQDLARHGPQALLGREQSFDADWLSAAGGAQKLAVRLVPDPPGAQAPNGYYGIASPIALAPAASGRSADAGDAGHVSEAAYFEVMERELSPDENPREFLLHAIEHDSFTLLSQTIQPLSATLGLPFYEVLLRLGEQEERMLRPERFFEIAERYELMPQIDRWVLRTLLKACSGGRRADSAWRMPMFSVNLSSATLRDARFAGFVRAALERSEVPGSRLCLEIGHADLMSHEAEVGQLMEALKPSGCRFAVDGFGAQKVSFTPFRTLRFDFLKIDGGIVGGLARDRAHLAKAHAIAMACQKMGVHTIAQCVEDEDTRVKLISIGVNYAQGYAIATPGDLPIPGA